MRRVAWPVGLLAAAALILGLLLVGGGVLTSGTRPSTSACGAPAASFGTGAIGWPLTEGSFRLSSGYGPRAGGFHAGIDLAAPIGTPIHAAHDGTVERAGPATGFGLWVVLRGTLPDGSVFSTVYGHVNTFDVEEGQVVSAGQKIAEVGNRGESTGPHLHFEVWPGGRFGGTSVDPAGWLATNVQPGSTTQPVADGTVDTVALAGPAAPSGTQATMAITAEQQRNVDAIVGTVKGQGLPLRVAVIAVATAMQESTLRVIDYGDTAGPDSRGLFQQRAPWGPYETRMDPVGSTLLFLNGGVGGQAGLLAHDWQNLPLERVVVQTQVSVGGYAKWEGQAMRLVAAAAGVDPLTAGLGPNPSTCGLPAAA